MIVEAFLAIIEIEVIFVSTYKTTAMIDRKSDGKIILLIVGRRNSCFRVSICFNSVVILIFSYCGFCLKWFLEVYIRWSILWCWWCQLSSCSKFVCWSPLSEWYWPSTFKLQLSAKFIYLIFVILPTMIYTNWRQNHSPLANLLIVLT